MLKQRRSNHGSTWTGRLARQLRVRSSGADDTGASLVEYALLLALIAVVAIGALTFLGNTVSNSLNSVANNIATVGAPATPTAPSFSPNTATYAFVDLSLGSYTANAAGTGPITYTESGTLPQGVSFSDGVVSGTPAAGDYSGSPYSVSITATNAIGSSSLALTLTVTEAGDNDTPPSFTPDTATAAFTDGTAGTYTANAAGSPAPTYTESGALPDGLTFSDGVVSGTPAYGDYGESPYAVTITASNGVGTPAHLALTIDVAQAASDDTPPLFSPNTVSATFTDGTAGSYTADAGGSPTPTYTESGALPSGLSFSDGVISGTPNSGDYKNSPYAAVTITATNTVGISTLTLTIDVNSGAVDDSAPAFNPSSAVATFTDGTAGSFSESASGVPTPTYALQGGEHLPSGLSLTGDVISGTPANGDYLDSPQTFGIIATNSAGHATLTLTLNILQAGDNGTAPSFHPTSASTTFQDGSLGFYDFPNANGDPAPNVTESGTLPNGLTYDGFTGTIVGTPSYGDYSGSPYTITLTATNGVGTPATFTLTLNVTKGVNFAQGSQTMNVTSNHTTTATYTATGDPTITYSLSGLPAWASINASTGVVTVTDPPHSTHGNNQYKGTITATDGTGTDTLSLTVNVTS